MLNYSLCSLLVVEIFNYKKALVYMGFRVARSVGITLELDLVSRLEGNLYLHGTALCNSLFK